LQEPQISKKPLITVSGCTTFGQKDAFFRNLQNAIFPFLSEIFASSGFWSVPFERTGKILQNANIKIFDKFFSTFCKYFVNILDLE